MSRVHVFIIFSSCRVFVVQIVYSYIDAEKLKYFTNRSEIFLPFVDLSRYILLDRKYINTNFSCRNNNSTLSRNSTENIRRYRSIVRSFLDMQIDYKFILVYARAHEKNRRNLWPKGGKSYIDVLTLRAAVGLAGLLRYPGIHGRGMGRRLIVAGRSCCGMRVGSRRGSRRDRGCRLLGLLLLLLVADGWCCRRVAVGSPGWLLLLLLLLLRRRRLLLLRHLLRRRRFLRVSRLFAHRLCETKRAGSKAVLNINSSEPACGAVLPSPNESLSFPRKRRFLNT